MKIDHINDSIADIAKVHALCILLGNEDARSGIQRRTSRELAEHFCQSYTAAHEANLRTTYEVGYHQALWHKPAINPNAPPVNATPAVPPPTSLDELEKELAG